MLKISVLETIWTETPCVCVRLIIDYYYYYYYYILAGKETISLLPEAHHYCNF